MKVDALSKYYDLGNKCKPKTALQIFHPIQKDDLERQIDNVRIYLQAKGSKEYDIGSGIKTETQITAFITVVCP